MLGRFTSADPGNAGADLTNPQSWNGYAYVSGNPLANVDPTGQDGEGFWNSIGNFFSNLFGSGGCNADFCATGYSGPTIDPQNNAQGDLSFGLSGEFSSGSSYYQSGATFFAQATAYKPVQTQSATASPPKSGTNAARWCTVPAPPGGAWPSVQRTAWAGSLLVDFLTGTGPANFNFAPDSVPSQGMASTDGVQTALNDYYMTGRTSGLYTFNAPEVIRTGANSMGQFVGSFNWTITPANGGINLSLSNYTSVWSGAYHQLSSHSRSSFAPLGTTHQTYNIYARCGG